MFLVITPMSTRELFTKKTGEGVCFLFNWLEFTGLCDGVDMIFN